MNIAAPPREGEANAELLDFLSGVLGIKKSALSLPRGSKSRDKIVAVSNMNIE